MNSQTVQNTNEVAGFEIVAEGPINRNMPAYTGPAYDSPEGAAERAADAVKEEARRVARIAQLAADGYVLNQWGKAVRVA